MSEKHFTDVGGHFSSGVAAKDNEPVEIMLKRFKREVINAGVLSELKKREFFEKPSVLRKRAKEAAVRKRTRSRRFSFNSD